MLTLSQIKQRLPYYYESGISLHFTSAPGRGKSTVIAEAPVIIGRVLGKRLGIVTINAAMLTPMHLMGFGVPKHSEDHSEMIFTDPFFWTTDEGKRLNEYDGGIVIDHQDIRLIRIGLHCVAHRYLRWWPACPLGSVPLAAVHRP